MCPFPGGTGGAHDDSQHQGSAKRNGASGVKGIDAASNLTPQVVMDDIDAAILNAANGIAGLNAAGQVAIANLPVNVASGIIGLDTNRDQPHIYLKSASANLRHSNDAEAFRSPGQASYGLMKTFTFDYGIKGTIRVAFDMKTTTGTLGNAKLLQNGVTLIGAEQSENSVGYTTHTQDVAVNLEPGDTLELWVKENQGGDAFRVQNYRISYDNATLTTLVDGVTAS